MCCGAAVDLERGDDRNLTFEDKTTRRNFIRKVYMILALQLLVTFGLVYFAVGSDEFYDYVEANPGLWWVAFGVVLVSLIAIACCGDLRRKAPWNFIILGMFTLAEAFLCSVIASQYDPHTVLMALGLTALICVSLSIFAMQTKIDFTPMSGIMCVCALLLIAFSIVLMFYRTFLLMMIYCSIGVLIFSIYLIIDTQMLMGGNRSVVLAPDEYVFAALTLYVDIIAIFIYILQILGLTED